MVTGRSLNNTFGGPNWRHVGIFLGLCFGLTYALDLAIFLSGGLQPPSATTLLQFQMLLPAFSAILLGLCSFTNSPLYHGRPLGRPRWFYFGFLGMVVVSGVCALGVALAPSQQPLNLIAASAPVLLSVLGLVLLGVLRLTGGRQAMAHAWLAGANWRYWLMFALAIVAYYVLEAVLNGLFGLGGSQLTPPAVLPPGMTPQTFYMLAAIQAVLLGPVIGLVIAFGEEFGWRGYLQTEVFKLGRRRGVILLGVIWGAWHWPIILMGFNYPGHPLLGVLLMTLYTTGLAVVLGYAVLRTGSVLLSSFLHALNNQAVAYLVAIGLRPFDAAFGFMIGTWGMLTLALVAAVILLDPVWRGSGSTLFEPELDPAPLEHRIA